MTNEVPNIEVITVNNPVTSRPGMANKIALIGAFNSEATDPAVYLSVDEAKTALGTDTTFNGCKVIDPLFVGASSILAVNVTTWSGSGSEKTADKSMTVAKLTAALAKIKGEDFDIVFVADTLTDTMLPVLTAFLDDCYEMKAPAGYIGCISGQTSAADIASAALAGNHCYGLITQSANVGGVTYDLLQTAAYYCGIIAGLQVGQTMTSKVVPYVIGVSPEYTYETGDAGTGLVGAGITCFKCQNRTTGSYVVVNSAQPNGWDLYINRSRDFIVKEMSLTQFLGERNRKVTHDAVMQELARVKDVCVNQLDLCADISYTVKKESSKCLGIYLDSIKFDDIITKIKVYVRVEVE